MPRRQFPLANGEVYHLFNRSVGAIPIFKNSFCNTRMINLIDFYRFEKPSLRFSHYNRLEKEAKKKFIENLYDQGEKMVEIYAFCLMPNHLHFLLKQVLDGGIRRFMRNIQDAYAKYFNTKYKRSGSLFQLMFRAVRIETNEQLTHVCRYIHLNPLTSYILRETEELRNYEWSSFGSYTEELPYHFIDTEFILNILDNRDRLIKFTFDQLDYQRELDNVKHLILE